MKARGDRIKIAIRGLAQVMALAIALHGSVLPSYAHADDLDTICGPTLNNPQPSPTPGAANADIVQQKLQYCQAAKSASDGADADSALWKVWAAVGVVCTYACVASFVGGPTSQYLCMGVSLAGGVTDAIVTKNFTSAMMAVGGVAAGFAVNSAVNGGKEVAKEGVKEAPKKQDKDIGACLNAAMAALQAFMKYKSMQDSESTEQTNLASAKGLQAPTGTTADGAASYQAATGGGVGTSGTSGNGGVANGNIAGSSTLVGNTSNSSCAGLRSGSSSGSAIVQCATASDTTLPGFVNGSKFPEEFQKDSGKSLASFLAGNGPPGPQMTGASTNGMSASQSATIASAIDGVAQSVGNSEYAAVYAGSGGGGGGAGEDGGSDMAALAQSLMDQMNPNGKKKEAASTGVSAVIFANRSRTPTAVTEDRKLSIFDRVSYRYYYVGRRILFGEGNEGLK